MEVIAATGHLLAATKIIQRVLVAAYSFCLLFVIGGFVLLYKGTQSATSVAFFGARIETASIGLICLFFGAVMLVILVRLTLRTVVDTLRIPELHLQPEEPQKKNEPLEGIAKLTKAETREDSLVRRQVSRRRGPK